MDRYVPPTLLVVEPDVLIGQDLCETLRGLLPCAAIHLARDAEAAQATLSRMDGLAAAFLGLSPHDREAAGIAQAVERHGGRVVILDAAPGGASPDIGAGRIHTGRPYGSEAVAEALETLGMRPSPAGAR